MRQCRVPLLNRCVWLCVQWDDKDGHYIIKLGESLLPRYKILKVIGEGTFGKVTQCWDRTEKKYVAIKIIKSIPKYREAAKVEIEILKDIERRDKQRVSGCITMLESFDFRNHFCLVFDLLGMSMYDFLRQNSYRAFSLQEVQIFGRQLLRTVAFLHKMRLIHTDLKLENILLVNSDWQYHRHPIHGRSRVVKCKDLVVIDLGSATYESDHHASIVSTRHYRAPEVVLGLGWTYPCDLWSVGCILLELFTGEATFQTHDNLEHLAMMERIFGPLPRVMTTRADRRTVGRFLTERGDLRWPEDAAPDSLRAVERMRPLAVSSCACCHCESLCLRARAGAGAGFSLLCMHTRLNCDQCLWCMWCTSNDALHDIPWTCRTCLTSHGKTTGSFMTCASSSSSSSLSRGWLPQRRWNTTFSR